MFVIGDINLNSALFSVMLFFLKIVVWNLETTVLGMHLVFCGKDTTETCLSQTKKKYKKEEDIKTVRCNIKSLGDEFYGRTTAFSSDRFMFYVKYKRMHR